ncbi:hypothetical protein HYH03_000405 [Edaphochlamys debaryana]|uniref:Uncharacterized protein n=1 Tax=Edaphochlamys debaryana TaxID=47281 RepID=A0A835YHF6_9CHLO|nr:hypothetical protein HYH03_000405 [Edaphochlamys debaryana]|eukprot:KAG2501907.1 hypothetical protein HYH03_000405 [Edaphochlamys debaryana]
MQLQRARPFATSRPCRRSAPSVSGARPGRNGRALAVRVQASAKADSILVKAKAKYEEGDRLQAMKLYEDVMAEDPTPQQKVASLYGQTAVHAAFGDVELAQMTLREALRQGLSYEQALQDPTYVRMATSPQIEIQLRRFAQQITIAMANRPPTDKPYGAPARSRAPSSMAGMQQDLDSFMGSSSGDQAEVDTSVAAIAKRVALLLLAGTGLFIALFYLGLEYLFPKLD